MEFRKKTILIADDNKTFLMYISMLLKRMGFQIIPTENGIGALKLLQLVGPDLIMIDVNMPLMDGITLLKHIKNDKQTFRIPVVMVSVDSNEKTIKKCEELGCMGYLVKPVDIDSLHDILQDCIFSRMGIKRKHLRSQFNKKVSVFFNGIQHDLYAETLSEGGIYLRKKDPFPVGSELEVQLPLKDGHSLDLKGIVIYVKGIFGALFKIPPGIAIEFKDISRDDSIRLTDYVIDLLAGDILESQEEIVIKKKV